MNAIDEKLQPILNTVLHRNAGEPEFHQAAREVLESLGRVIARSPEYSDEAQIEHICEPERQIIFRVPWIDDNNQVQINRGLSLIRQRRDTGGVVVGMSEESCWKSLMTNAVPAPSSAQCQMGPGQIMRTT